MFKKTVLILMLLFAGTLVFAADSDKETISVTESEQISQESEIAK